MMKTGVQLSRFWLTKVLEGKVERLHRLKVLHGVLEGAGEVLDTARPGIRCTGEEFTW